MNKSQVFMTGIVPSFETVFVSQFHVSVTCSHAKDNSLKNSLFIINYVIRIFDYSPCALKDMLICNYNGDCSFNFKERQK